MISRRLSTAAFCVTLCLTAPSNLLGMGGTSIVATKGSPAHVSAGWPEGVGDLVNDPLRTTGWNSWFSEWPNDVNQYAFEVGSTAEVNGLIVKLASIKSEIRQIRLSHLKEPSGLGWTTRLPKGNKIPIIFSIGDQSTIDAWYKSVRKPFGVMEFVAAPTAVPPTLTIFVQHEAIHLDELRIPAGVHVAAGYAPTVFHRFNTTDEKRREEEAASEESGGAASSTDEELDRPAQAAVAQIEAFLKKRNGATKP